MVPSLMRAPYYSDDNMQTITLASIPNQSLSITLDGNIFDLVFKWAGNCVVWSASINAISAISNSRVINGQMMLPYRHLETGNFLFLTEGDELPDYNQFGATQNLVYITKEELAALR
jgi:hypothetical protein